MQRRPGRDPITIREQQSLETMTSSNKVQYNLGSLDRIPPGEGRVVRVGNTDITIFRTRGGAVYATQAACPHRSGPLADGLVGPDSVICPLHSYKFELATGQPLGNTCDALKTYDIAVNGAGELILGLGEEEVSNEELQ